MEKRMRAARAWLVSAGITIAIGAAPMSGATAQDTGDSSVGFMADVSIRHATQTDDGLITWSPARVVAVTRERAAQGWRTVLVNRSRDTLTVETATGTRTLEDPFAIARTEIDDSGAVRLFDRHGALVRAPEFLRAGWPTSADAHAARRQFDAQSRHLGSTGAVDPSSWARELVLPSGHAEGRRRRLEQRYGQPLARIRGLDRFVAISGDTTHEVLVSPETAVPVEMNTAIRGRLVRRVVLTYGSVAGGLYRRNVRTEQAIGGHASRLLTDVEILNIAIGREAAR